MSQGKIHDAGPAYRCPKCKTLLDGYTSAEAGDDAVPTPGALTVCAHCGEIGEYVEGGIESLSAQAFDALPEDVRQQLRRIQALAHEIKKRPFPPAYYHDCEAMKAAAETWMREHPCAHLVFKKLDEGVLFIGALDAEVIQELGRNEPARELLRVMDRACGNRATILQARSVLEVLFAPEGGPGA